MHSQNQTNATGVASYSALRKREKLEITPGQSDGAADAELD